MGVVFAAHDPRLDRRIALKVIRSSALQDLPSIERFVREAQALGKLSHPNVVAVFDVGTIGDEVFIAMELIEGVPLSTWIHRLPPPSPHAVLNMFVDIGRGLAAAHAHGIVHRDIKPDNVLVGEDGRARVMDFGLAFDDSPGSENSVHTAGQAQRLQFVRTRLTQTGAVMGTPLYMSPEQLDGRRVDARSDQFSYCVSLFEALFRRRPFSATTLADLYTAVHRGAIEFPSDKAVSVPSSICRVIRRGLSVDRDARFSTMEALLAALVTAKNARRRRLVQGCTVAGLTAVGLGAVLMTTSSDATVCAGLDAQLENVWDTDTRHGIEARLTATKLPYARQTAAHVDEVLDVYAKRWLATRIDICHASLDAAQPARDLDLRTTCLDGRMLALRAATTLLRNANAAVAQQAVALVEALPSLQRCSDVSALTAVTPPPDDPQVIAAMQRLNPEVARIHALQSAGKVSEALTVLDTHASALDAIEHPPFAAELARIRGRLYQSSGDYAKAESALKTAYTLALEHGMNALAGDVADDLVVAIGVTASRPADAETWVRDARILAGIVGSDTAQARYLAVLARLRLHQGRVAEAQARLREAWQLYRRALGPTSLRTASVRRSMGSAALGAKDYVAAREHFTVAHTVIARVLGPKHPNTLSALSGLADCARAEGHFAEAQRLIDEVLAIQRVIYGEDHAVVAASLLRAGNNARAAGDTAQAGQYYQQAVTTWSSTLGPDHPRVARALVNLGATQDDMRDDAGARTSFLRALQIQRTALESDHPDIATTLHNLAEAESRMGLLDEARAHYRRATAIMEGAYGKDATVLAFPLTGLGEVALRQGKPKEARALLERAHALAPKQRDERDDLGETAFALAQAIWDDPDATDDDRTHAGRLAREAAAAFAEVGASEDARRMEAIRWMKAHRL